MEENVAKFDEKLKSLVALAKKKKNILEIQEINEVFKDMELAPEQMEKVFEYLDICNIDVLRISEDIVEDDFDDGEDVVINDNESDENGQN